MNIEDKKFLAEKLMGWHTDEENPLHFWVWHESFKETVTTYEIDKWNPDTNHEQFKAVIEKFESTKMTKKQIDKMSEVFIGAPLGGPLFTSYLWMANNLPKIMEAVLEVLKNDKV